MKKKKVSKVAEKTAKQLAEAIAIPVEATSNRRAKDSVFTDLFQHPKYLFQLYQAIHPEDNLTCEDDLTLVTLENVLLNESYNDLGFVVGNKLMILVEAQSTWSVNIVIRFLMYLADTYQRYIENNEFNIYGSKTISLPIPELYVVYHKEQGNRPETISLARDVFGKDDDVAVDVTAKVIYNSQEGDIINQYIVFCRVFDYQVKIHGRTRKAVEETIRICRNQDILREYLAEKEVETIMFRILDQDKAYELAMKEGRAEGRAEGENLLSNLISKLMSLGKTDDVMRVTSDAHYREELYIQYGIKPQ